MLGGGAGTILDMIIRHRNNIAMLRKKSLFKRDWNYFSTKNEYVKAAGGKIPLQEATKEELALVRAKVLQERKNDRIKTILIFVIIIPIILFVGYTFMNSFTKVKSVGYQEEKAIQPTRNDYLFFITDGDYWLKQNHWHNAIFQYNKALEVIPDDYEASYRLAIANIYRCQSENLKCHETELFLNNLINKNSNNIKLLELRADYYFIMGDTAKAYTDYEIIEGLNNKNIIR